MASEPPIEKLKAFRELSPELYDRGVALWETKAGVNELAWTRADAMLAVAVLTAAGHCILGGDVWDVDPVRDPRATYDNWYYNPTGAAEDAANSGGLAVQFIASYEGKAPGTRFTIVWR